MKATEFINNTLGMTGQIFVGLAEDLRDNPLHRVCPGGNHAMWCVGHIAFTDASFNTLIFGDANPLERWADLFRGGSQPLDDASAYPAYGDVINEFNQTRDNWIQRIASLTDDDLDQPSAHPPEGFEPIFGTVGGALGVLATHSMHHRGQLADIRRSLQLQPLMA